MEVLKKEEKILSKEEAAEFYKQHEGSEHFEQLVEFMSRYCKLRNGKCAACVHRVMDARGRLLKHERSARVA